MRDAEPPAMHPVLSAVAAVYPAETESLRASSVSLLGIRATLQHVVDQNLAFLVRLRIDGLQLAEIALLLGALGVCSAGSSISVKSLQSAMSRANMRSNQSASLRAKPDRNHHSGSTNAKRLFTDAADRSALQPPAAGGVALQGASSNSGLLQQAAANRSALRPIAAICTEPQSIAGLGEQVRKAGSRPENANKVSPLTDLDPRVQKAAELLSRIGESNE